MSRDELIGNLSSFRGSEETFPFGPETLVYKVKGKMFALVGHRLGKDFVNLKADPQDVLFFIDQFDYVSPGYHMNKKHWISVDITNPDSEEILETLVKSSYNLIVAKLTKRERDELGA